MSRPSRRSSPRKPWRDALQAGALVGGLFLSLLGVLRAVIRLGLLPRGEIGLLLPLAIIVVLVPLGAGIKFGFRDDTPPALRAYKHALPWSRSPTEELLGAVLGGAFWAALGMGLAWLLERLLPAPGVGHVVLTMVGPALASGACWAIHGRAWPAAKAFSLVLLLDLALAAPQLALGPRGPLGGAAGLGVLARENFEAAEQHGQNPTLLLRARSLATQGCSGGNARACFLASFAMASHEGSDGGADELMRRGCDLTTTDLALCGRYVGDGFSTSAPVSCSVESRCAAGYGVECRAGLLGCKRELSPRELQPACARREPAGWREVWCALPATPASGGR